MTENEFDRDLRRRNAWLAFAAIGAVVWGVMLLYGALAVHDVLRNHHYTLAFALLLVVLVSNLGTWLAATARRQDLYTIARGSSVTQLKRFRSEIDDVIELLENDEKVTPMERARSRT